jgi:Na+-driven multidrug efflux pump
VVNVVLNLIFVIIFSMGVAGVALATVISQVISALLVIRCLIGSEGDYKLCLDKLHITKDKMLKMAQIGLPAGLQGVLFSLSNVLIQSSVNSFGSVAMAGNTAASNVEGFVYMAMNAFYQTAISFTGQNYGAMKYKRIGKILLQCEGMVLVVGLVLGNASYFFAEGLLGLYSDSAEVIEYGILRLSIIGTFYCLCGMMDVMVGMMRGIGYSVLPMLVSLTGACLFRVVWIYTLFHKIHTLKCLYWSYPISWTVTFLVHLLCFALIYRKLCQKEA